MSSAAAVRAGRAFVEISADDTQFQRALKQVHNRMAMLGQSLRRVGTQMGVGAAALGLPMVLAARQAQAFDDALLELKGSVSDITPKQLKAVREESLRLSKALGISPAAIAQSFAMLVKAGMSVEDALGGAAKSAVEFAAVSGVSAQEAATFMKVAMNVFGTSSAEAVDTLSAAADASETDIRHMVEAFGLVGSAGKTFQQSLFGVSQAFAALASYGIQGEEAGTGIKVLLSRLVAPSSEAAKALGLLGLSVESFRDAEGRLLPIVQIVDIISRQLRGMSKEARGMILSQKALVDVFGDRGIKVISAFADMGVEGFNEIADAMEANRSVSEKFDISMEGISGGFKRMAAAVERLSIAFMVGLAPAFSFVSHAAAGVIDGLAWLLTSVPVLSPLLAALTATAFALGVTAVGLGAAIAVVNFGLRGWLKMGPLVTIVTNGMTAAVARLATAFAALSLAIKRVPLVGWALAAIAATGVIAWLISASDDAETAPARPGKRGKIARDQMRDPLAQPGDPSAQPSGKAFGESLGTFASQIAGQLGIGPSLTAADRTADNTARTADAVEELARNDRARVPDASVAQAGLRTASPTVSRGVAANSGREMLSAQERAALAAEQSASLLRQLVDSAAKGAGLVFA